MSSDPTAPPVHGEILTGVHRRHRWSSTEKVRLIEVNRPRIFGGSNSWETGAMTKHTPLFSPDVRERAVRLVREQESEHGSQYAATRSIEAKIANLGRLT